MGSCKNTTDVKTSAAAVTGNPNTTSSSSDSKSDAASFAGSLGLVGILAFGVAIALT